MSFRLTLNYLNHIASTFVYDMFLSSANYFPLLWNYSIYKFRNIIYENDLV